MRYVNVDQGVRCALEDIKASGNSSGNSTVLFVHGWPLAREMYEYQCNILPQCGVRCIIYDLRGYGDSDKPYEGYSYDRMADDLHNIIQSINCRCITLCGFSMGGAVCTRYMSRYGNNSKVNKLALCGAACPVFVETPYHPSGMPREEVDGFIDLAQRDRPLLCSEFSRMMFASNPSEPYLRWIEELTGKASGYATVKGLFALRDEDLTGDLRKIRVPTAILHGVQDQICPYSFAGEMHEGIRNSYVVPFEHSGHGLFFDEKEKFANEIINFINS